LDFYGDLSEIKTRTVRYFFPIVFKNSYYVLVILTFPN